MTTPFDDLNSLNNVTDYYEQNVSTISSAGLIYLISPFELSSPDEKANRWAGTKSVSAIAVNKFDLVHDTASRSKYNRTTEMLGMLLKTFIL